jgi:PEP-CTERM motif
MRWRANPSRARRSSRRSPIPISSAACRGSATSRPGVRGSCFSKRCLASCLIDIYFAKYAPKTGDAFDFINVVGGADFSGASIDVLGLAPGFQYNDSFSNGGFDLIALNHGALAPVPEPSTLALMGLGCWALDGFGGAERRMHVRWSNG